MIMELGSAEYWRLFDFQHTAFRLEVHQLYRGDDETGPLRDFIAGRPCPALPGKDAWVARVSAAHAAGKVMRRVHAATEPLTPYMQMELAWSYPPNVRAGEDIRILRAAPGDPVLSETDFWLFDSRTLLQYTYDEGRLARVELVADPAEIVRANWLRDAAAHGAVPLRDYLRWHDGLVQRAS
ncbi:MAG TPA: hypothetical protein VMK13_13495 [Streptosporangiaceae bacterium]|nr:hypothetical protein [Streptosporangiaceae bacterium]